MRAVDTNSVLRVVTRDDEQQLEAAEQFIASGAWVSHLVIAEAAWVLRVRYDRSHEEIATAIEMLLRHQDFTLEDSDVVENALVLYRQRPSLRFTDCLILEIARKAGHLPLGTFDKNLGRIEGAERL